MSLRKKLSSIIALSAAVGAFAVAASAQDTPAPVQDNMQKQEKRERKAWGERGEHGKKGMHAGRRAGFRGLKGIDLTDAQKEQIRQIHEANKPSETEMTELRTIREARKSGAEITAEQKDRMKAIREQSRTKRESVHQQVLAILTVEQRAQLEARKAEMEKKRLERKELRKNRTTTEKPTDN